MRYVRFENILKTLNVTKFNNNYRYKQVQLAAFTPYSLTSGRLYSNTFTSYEVYSEAENKLVKELTGTNNVLTATNKQGTVVIAEKNEK